MNVTGLRLEFYGDGGPSEKDGIEFDPSALVFNTNDSVKELSLTNISTGINDLKSIRFLPLDHPDGPFQEHVELNGVKKNVPVTVTLNQKQKALAIVKYTSGKNKITSDKVVVSVDGKPNVLIPVSFKKVETAYEEEEEVYRESTELDFGCVVVNRKTVAREISLVNYGSKTGAFRIKYEGSRLIEFIPTSGSVPPNRELRIKVKLETKHPGKIEEKVEVTLGHETKSMHVRANVLESEDMLDQKTEDMPSAMERDTIQVCPENLKIEEPQDTVEEPDSLIQSSTGRRKRCVVFSGDD
ncbi:uncharacterized protein LOC123548925 isoform X3 [Mercenaria mercenaria]|uniref:uncharacterized protein LOC123548925 isoform X3 n=1 Tax=Mercenaria mercenaria TaxID=6596 RepID=UPI00234E538C|nr:uncharacterized protein LOC123548925 isoform X3 [Mercenaria mercenaria]